MSVVRGTEFKEKTAKLKDAEQKISEEISILEKELEVMKQKASQGEIELSVIQDSIKLHYGEENTVEFDVLIDISEKINEFVRLEGLIANDKIETQQLMEELTRLQNLEAENIDSNINIAKSKQDLEDMQKVLQSTKIRNSKYQKSNKLLENKIYLLEVRINELNESLKQKSLRMKENLAIVEQSKLIKEEICGFSDKIKTQNQSIKDIQIKFSEAMTEIEQIEKNIEREGPIVDSKSIEDSKYLGILSYIQECNKPWRDFKAKYETFCDESSIIERKLAEKLVDLNSLIDLLREETGTVTFGNGE